MEAVSFFRNLKISPKKLRFFLPEIKKKSPAEALDYLLYLPNKAAKVFYKVIKSALSNAKNQLKVDVKSIEFKHLSVEQGQRLKRFKAGSRGTAMPILRRFAHVKVILESQEPTKKTETLNPKSEILNKSKFQKSKVKNKKI